MNINKLFSNLTSLFINGWFLNGPNYKVPCEVSQSLWKSSMWSEGLVQCTYAALVHKSIGPKPNPMQHCKVSQSL